MASYFSWVKSFASFTSSSRRTGVWPVIRGTGPWLLEGETGSTGSSLFRGNEVSEVAGDEVNEVAGNEVVV